MKICSSCKLEKDYIHFNKSKSNKDGYQYNCKECYNVYRLENKIKIKHYRKEYEFKNQLTTKERKKQYYIDNKNVILEKTKKYYKENKLFYKEYNKNYVFDKRNKCSLFKFRCNVRTLILGSFKRGKNQFRKEAKTENILGCTIEEFIKYISSKFTEGMTLDNHGEWHLDHIYPVSLAKSEEEIIKLNHYTNFQPLWAEDNLRKGNRLDY